MLYKIEEEKVNIANISAIPYAEKKILVFESCLMYRKLFKTNKLLDEKKKSLKLNDSAQIESWKTLKSISIFETIISLLEPELGLIIENDFIKLRNQNWYNDYWSKSTYYKLKHQAIDQFIFLFYA